MGPKQSLAGDLKRNQVLRKSGADSERARAHFRFRMRGRATWVPFPSCLSNRASSHPDWLGGERPQLLPLLNQRAVSVPPVHR